jgi:hypothetical protein
MRGRVGVDFVLLAAIAIAECESMCKLQLVPQIATKSGQLPE